MSEQIRSWSLLQTRTKSSGGSFLRIARLASARNPLKVALWRASQTSRHRSRPASSESSPCDRRWVYAPSCSGAINAARNGHERFSPTSPDDLAGKNEACFASQAPPPRLSRSHFHFRFCQKNETFSCLFCRCAFCARFAKEMMEGVKKRKKRQAAFASWAPRWRI